MERLKGQKVWLVQYDDDDDSLIGVVDNISEGFISLRSDGDTTPSLWVNLANVKEIELFREEETGRRSHLSVVPIDGKTRPKPAGKPSGKPGGKPDGKR